MRSKMRWRNSSSDEDSESDARVVSNGNSMTELRDADRGTPKNSRLFPKFNIKSDGESEEDSGLMSRASAGKKIFSKAALRNYDMKNQRRVPRSIEECSDPSNEMQEIRDELWKKQAYAYDTTRRDAEEESLLTKKRYLLNQMIYVKKNIIYESISINHEILYYLDMNELIPLISCIFQHNAC